LTSRPHVAHSEESPSEIVCDALVIGATSDDGNVTLSGGDGLESLLNGRIMDALRGNAFKAKQGEVTIIPTLGEMPAHAIAVAGLGSESEVDEGAIRKAAAAAARMLSERPVIASLLHRAHDGGNSAAVEGYVLASYAFTTYKSVPQTSKTERILFVGGTSEGIERGLTLSEATIVARDLVNEPAGELTPQALAEHAQEVADAGGLESEVMDENDLAARGFGGIVGVGQGSASPPRLIKLHYPAENPSARLALVGKGVTFDSGGLSLKEARSMEEMKTDMAGGAAVIAAVGALGRLDTRADVTAYIPAVENMPSGTALKPGDVIRHYGGRTTEVTNTDAEGRLILADALALASEAKPDAIVDVATLTGSILVALGKKAVGLFCNDDGLAEELEDAADGAGERMWRMPLYDDYLTDLDSEVADCKNAGSRYGGSIVAALFLKQFVAKNLRWAHLDIAGAARADKDYDETTKGASGVATRTLIGWMESHKA
jgi:leucyl aminopeptidase